MGSDEDYHEGDDYRADNYRTDDYPDEEHEGAVTGDEYDDRAFEPDDDVARTTAAGDDEMVYASGRRGDDSWLGEGVGVALVLVGVLLFLFPEPATSLTGVLLIVAGLVVWMAAEMR